MTIGSASLLLIGCGKMGTAMLNGWLSADKTLRVTVVDPHPPAFLYETPGITVDETVAMRGSAPETVILAIKPQQMDEVCTALKPALTPDTLVISIAAGQTTARIRSFLHPDQPIVRCMPNTPAAIGRGITGAFATKSVSEDQKTRADGLLAAMGETVWLEDESLLDAVTALSGSGPAYVFALIEVLAKAGGALGLPADLAMKLARATVTGSAALADAEKTLPASTLRQNVTSPGGTTAAALKILMDSGALQHLFDDALAAAAARAKELSR